MDLMRFSICDPDPFEPEEKALIAIQKDCLHKNDIFKILSNFKEADNANNFHGDNHNDYKLNDYRVTKNYNGTIHISVYSPMLLDQLVTFEQSVKT